MCAYAETLDKVKNIGDYLGFYNKYHCHAAIFLTGTNKNPLGVHVTIVTSDDGNFPEPGEGASPFSPPAGGVPSLRKTLGKTLGKVSTHIHL